MEKRLSMDELKELEAQLSCPVGKIGLEVGANMHQSNLGMIMKSIQFLDLQDNLRILEIGHGNGKHLEKFMNMANHVHYTGLEISNVMQDEAIKNRGAHNARYQLYDGTNIPFPDASFDRVLSVNTIYFWVNPKRLLLEIERVLDVSGVCVLSYINKEFAKNLPFVGERFKLYDHNEIKDLIHFTNLNLVDHQEVEEDVISKSGQPVKRTYHMIKIQRYSDKFIE